MAIMLEDIWPIANLEDYKIHFARYNKHSQPLEVWARDTAEWQGWQEYRPKRDEFNRPLIFSLMRFYHEENAWLFGGIFRILKRYRRRYNVNPTGHGAEFIGRLKLRSPYRARAARVNMDRYYPQFEVQEILREPYSSRQFPG